MPAHKSNCTLLYFSQPLRSLSLPRRDTLCPLCLHTRAICTILPCFSQPLRSLSLPRRDTLCPLCLHTRAICTILPCFSQPLRSLSLPRRDTLCPLCLHTRAICTILPCFSQPFYGCPEIAAHKRYNCSSLSYSRFRSVHHWLQARLDCCCRFYFSVKSRDTNNHHHPYIDSSTVLSGMHCYVLHCATKTITELTSPLIIFEKAGPNTIQIALYCITIEGLNFLWTTL